MANQHPPYATYAPGKVRVTLTYDGLVVFVGTIADLGVDVATVHRPADRPAFMTCRVSESVSLWEVERRG